MRNKFGSFLLVLALICSGTELYSQATTEKDKKEKEFKNVIRYNLSSGLLFGIDKYIVFGYERVVKPHQSFSINIGRANLPKLVAITTDSFNVKSDRKNTGFNVSVDYRFYLSKENKFNAPRGVYIGPYYSYNSYTRENDWAYNKTSAAQQLVSTKTDFKINTIGAELGYQFVLWKRLAIDLVMVGPGFSNYNIKATISDNLSPENKEQLQKAIQEIITQKFPGMNYVFSDKEFNANGNIKTWSVGYRYLIHIGFCF